jgi:hypothetical protein
MTESTRPIPHDEGVDEDIESRVGATAVFANAVAAFISNQGSFISLHSADPGLTGANEIAGGRKQTTWGAAAVASTGPDAGKSVVTGSVVEFLVPTGVTVAFYGVWTAATGGVFQYSKAVLPTATFAVAGTATVTPRHSFGLI